MPAANNPLLNRYVVRGEVHLGSGRWHFIASWRDLASAQYQADQTYGYDRVVVVDVADKNAVVWDSRI